LKIPDAIPVWKESSDNLEQALLEMWNTNKKFKENVLEKIIHDVVYQQSAKIVSSTLRVTFILVFHLVFFLLKV
jgi:hypothetical protein